MNREPGLRPDKTKQSSAAVRFEEPVCDVCGCVPTELLLTTRDLVWRKPGEFRLMRCTNCGLILTSPRPVPADMYVYYDDWYAYTTLEKARDQQVGCLGNRFVARSRLRLLEQTGPLERGMRVLDVGAGFGVQLDYYIRKRGIVATSLDFDAATCEASIVRDRAVIRTGDLLDAGFEAESFDVVTFYESLEHVYHPKAVLEEAFRILRPGGRLALDVPDYGAWWRKVWGRHWFGILTPAHLYHFTKPALRRLVEAAGFRIGVHRSLPWPYEATASMVIAYADWTGASVPDAMMIDRILKRRWRHLPFFMLLTLWTVLVDIPWQGPLSLLGRTGTQGLVAVKQDRR